MTHRRGEPRLSAPLLQHVIPSEVARALAFPTAQRWARDVERNLQFGF